MYSEKIGKRNVDAAWSGGVRCVPPLTHSSSATVSPLLQGQYYNEEWSPYRYSVYCMLYSVAYVALDGTT